MRNKILNYEINNIISRFNQKNKISSLVKDLTHLNTYSIDDNNTVEIDDAISLEKLADCYKLWIHIASPSSYIEYQSAIDKKARKLISTVYLSNSTLYMIPEILINNVFSLSDKVDRLSLSASVIINEDGSIYSSEIVQSLIKVNYRLNYTEAEELIDYAPKEEDDLNIISNILHNRKCWRMNSGAKEIVESYGKIIVEDNIPILKIIDPSLSRQLISEAMILFGSLISEYTKKNKIPVPYRVQDSKNEVPIKNISNLEEDVLNNYLLKKNMGKTYYSIKPMIHRSLGLRSYIHATSPIRRYADLLVHYQLNKFLNNKSLIPMNDVEQIIKNINIIGQQNIMRFREDQKFWLYKWFENNSFKEYKVILLSWINRYKNICILHFVKYNLSTICNLNSKLQLNVGDKFMVKNITNNYNDIIIFKLFND